MEGFNVILFCLAILAISFIKILVTNSIIYAVSVRKITNKKRLVLRASLFSEIAILITFISFSLFWTIIFISSLRTDNVVDRIINSIIFGLIANVTIGGYESIIGFIIAALEFVVALILIYCFNRNVVYKNLIMPSKSKNIFLLISSICNAPYFFIIPIVKIGFINDILNDIVIHWIY